MCNMHRKDYEDKKAEFHEELHSHLISPRLYMDASLDLDYEDNLKIKYNINRVYLILSVHDNNMSFFKLIQFYF